MKIYLAGPDVFLPDATAVAERKKALCARHGVFGLFPIDTKIDLTAPDASLRIFRANTAMMDEANAIVANLTPFRGPSADAGTVYELGYMAAKGKLCMGYSNDPAGYAERVATFSPTQRHPGGRIADTDDLTVEPFGLADNLMIVHALDLYGCPLVVPSSRPRNIWQDMATFEECIRLAANRLLPTDRESR